MSVQRILLGTRKGVLIFERSDGHWEMVHHAFRGSHVSIVFLDRQSGHLFACLDDGHFGNKLFRWNAFSDCTDFAKVEEKEVWLELETPKYPEDAKLPGGDDAVLKYQWAMSSGGPNQEGRIYLGTEPGGLFVSDNHGDSFQLNTALWNHPSRTDDAMPWFGGGRDEAGIHSVCVDPRDPDVIRVGISCAGVFLSEDGGESWRPTNKGCSAEFLPDPTSEVGQDPHLLVQCLSSPDHLWQQNHCAVYKSEDGGKNWLDVSESEGIVKFGFAVVVDPDDGDTAWVVPAESDMVRVAVNGTLCVSRTEDGGKSWTSISKGLPNNNCFDFAFRHCLKLQKNELVFGTACGSLYHSPDRGDSWSALASHLPPIYCVEVS